MSLLEDIRAGFVPAATSVGGEHETSGKHGYEALDVFGPPGSVVLAPESGRVSPGGWSGHNPAEGVTSAGPGVFGWSLTFEGDSGRRYYFTHLGSRTAGPGQRVADATPLGTIGDFPAWRAEDHVHAGVSTGDPTYTFGEMAKAGATPAGTTPGGPPSSGGGTSACDVICKPCDLIPLPDILKRANPVCIPCYICRGKGGADAVLDAIDAVPKALKFLFSIRFVELLGGAALLILGLALIGKQLGAPMPSGGPVAAALKVAG